MKTTAIGIAPLIAMMLLISSAHVFAETEKSEGALAYKFTDVVVVRPLGMGATVAGGIIYLVTWPISAATGNKKEMYNTLVRNPAKLGFGQRRAEKEEPLVQKEVVAKKLAAKQ